LLPEDDEGPEPPSWIPAPPPEDTKSTLIREEVILLPIDLDEDSD